MRYGRFKLIICSVAIVAALAMAALITCYFSASIIDYGKDAAYTSAPLSDSGDVALISDVYDLSEIEGMGDNGRALIVSDFTINKFNSIEDFSGVLDGGGHTLTLDISSDSKGYTCYDFDAGEAIGGIFAVLRGRVCNLKIVVNHFSHGIDDVGCSAGIICGVAYNCSFDNIEITLNYKSGIEGDSYLYDRIEHSNLGYPDNYVSLGGIAGYAKGSVLVTDCNIDNDSGNMDGFSLTGVMIDGGSGAIYSIGAFIGRGDRANISVVNARYGGDGILTCIVVGSAVSERNLSYLIGLTDGGTLVVDGYITDASGAVQCAGSGGQDTCGAIAGNSGTCSLSVQSYYFCNSSNIDAVGDRPLLSGGTKYDSDIVALTWGVGNYTDIYFGGLRCAMYDSEQLIFSIECDSKQYPVYEQLAVAAQENVGKAKTIKLSRSGNVVGERVEVDNIKLNYAICGTAVYDADYEDGVYKSYHTYDGTLPSVAVLLSCSSADRAVYDLMSCENHSTSVGIVSYKIKSNQDYKVIYIDGRIAIADEREHTLYALSAISDTVSVEILRASASIKFDDSVSFKTQYYSPLDTGSISQHIISSGFIIGAPVYNIRAYGREGEYAVGSPVGAYTLEICELSLIGGDIDNYSVTVSYAELTVTKKSATVALSIHGDIVYGDTASDIKDKVSVDSVGFIGLLQCNVICDKAAVTVGDEIVVSVNDLSVSDGIDNYDVNITKCVSIVKARKITARIYFSVSQVVYDGRSYKADYCIEDGSLAQGDKISIEYYECLGDDCISIGGLPINACYYKAVLLGDIAGDNYILGEGSVEEAYLTISKRALDYSLPDMSVVYGTRADLAVSSEYIAAIRQDLSAMIYEDYFLEFDLTDAYGIGYTAGVHAGSILKVSATVTFNAGDNYLINIRDGSATVVKRELQGHFEYLGETIGDITYDGYVKSLDYVLDTPLFDADVVNITMRYYNGDLLLFAPPCNAGSYVAQVYTFSSDYILSDICKFDISKAQRDIGARISPVYGGIIILPSDNERYVISCDGGDWVEVGDDGLISLPLAYQHTVALDYAPRSNYRCAQPPVYTVIMSEQTLYEYAQRLLGDNTSGDSVEQYRLIKEIDAMLDGERAEEYLSVMATLDGLYADNASENNAHGLSGADIAGIILLSLAAVTACETLLMFFRLKAHKQRKIILSLSLVALAVLISLGLILLLAV
ncbi:MAG: hypothetical protein K2M44_01715 [Clostridia bacterium]|nr:hypothetical protein [Clostridia bacterium]